MDKMNLADKKVKTPKFRVSFPSLDKPKSFQGQAPKYSVTMLFPKAADLSALKKAALNATIEKWGPKKEKWPKMKSPFRDGDVEKAGMMGYENVIFITASSREDNPPGLVDRDLEEINGKEIYAGSYARAELIAFAYDTAGNRGVSFSLQNVQKLGEGKKFSGKKEAKEVFDAVSDESDNEANYDTDSSDDESEDAMGF